MHFLNQCHDLTAKPSSTSGWFMVWKLFLVRFSFIRELVYGNDEPAEKKDMTQIYSKSNHPLRRSSRLRERQNKNQHGQI